MILMPIVQPMREHDIRIGFFFQTLEEILNVDVLARQIAVAEGRDNDLLVLGARQQCPGTAPCLVRSSSFSAENYPGHLDRAPARQPSHHSCATAYLEVVAVGTDT